MMDIDYRDNVIKLLERCKEGKDIFNAEVVRVMELNDIKDKTIQSNYKPQEMQYLLEGMDKCEFTNEQHKWIEQFLIFVDQNVYFADLKEFAPERFEKEVKETVECWGLFRHIKFK